MLVWLTLPFYDFWGFRSVAVNSVYKLQFFTFISNKFAKYHILFNTSTTSAHELPWKADVDEQVPVG